MDLSSLIPSFGNGLYTALAFVVALSIIVAVHEFGHYIVGRWSGIRAEVFSLGFGPRLVSRVDRHGTRWQIAAIPLGGYVRFLGDADAASGAPDEARLASMAPAERRHTLHGAPLWARAATVAAGPVANFLLAIAVFAGVVLASGTATDRPTIGTVLDLPRPATAFQPGDVILEIEGTPVADWAALDALTESLPARDSYSYAVDRAGDQITVQGPAPMPLRIAGIAPGTAAQAAGLREGDVVLSVDGAPVQTFAQLRDLVAASGGRDLRLVVWRAGEAAPLDLTLTPKRMDLPNRDGGFETRWLIGVTGGLFFTPATRSVGPVEALGVGASETWFILRSSVSGLWHMVTGAISTCNLRGPIGIAESSAAAATAGLPEFIWFIAVLSAAVGLMNLFPVPVLDGGHLIFHAWEWATGKPPSDKALRLLMSVGLVIVLTLMVFGLTNDLRC